MIVTYNDFEGGFVARASEKRLWKQGERKI